MFGTYGEGNSGEYDGVIKSDYEPFKVIEGLT